MTRKTQTLQIVKTHFGVAPATKGTLDGVLRVDNFTHAVQSERENVRLFYRLMVARIALQALLVRGTLDGKTAIYTRALSPYRVLKMLCEVVDNPDLQSTEADFGTALRNRLMTESGVMQAGN